MNFKVGDVVILTRPDMFDTNVRKFHLGQVFTLHSVDNNICFYDNPKQANVVYFESYQIQHAPKNVKRFYGKKIAK
jgi:hypothetical protein